MPRTWHVMTKPVGPICNLDCRYCFYLEKEELYPDTRKWKMPDEVLEAYVRQYIEQQDVPELSFAWQGGEPTLLGVEFFRRVVEVQQRYANGKVIHNAIQTNGTLLDDEWGAFLREQQFLVGLSVDGPEELHDLNRVDKKGAGTYRQVMAGLRTLKKHGVEFNTLTVVSRRNAKEPERVYRHLKDIGSRFLQFIPLVERVNPTVPLRVHGRTWNAGHTLMGPPDPNTPERATATDAAVSPWTVDPNDYGEFLCTVFDRWVVKDIGRTFVQLFDVALGRWLGLPASLCVFAETCGNALALEHNGDLYSCDHYVYPEHRLGNITTHSMRDMVGSAQQRKFGTDKRDTLPRYCRECEVRFACNGECPKHRFATTPDGEAGLNYLCPAFKRFFNHVDPHMKRMAALNGAGRPAADYMSELQATTRRVK